MFDALTKGFRQARNRLAGLTELTESTIEPALREVRLSLLEADVDLNVVKRFLATIKEQALGQTVRTRVKVDGTTHEVSAADQFIKLCHDELVRMMSHDQDPITWADRGPTGIMMVGLQGSGKTTTAAKLARLLSKEGKKPLLVAADMQRPAAVDQLQVLGKQIDIPVFNVDKSPPEICSLGLEHAEKNGFDVVIFDTAGRLAIDEQLMDELDTIKANVWPENIFLVVDAMIGQDAVKTAKAFHEKLDITGVILTKLDGDARGGAALSIKEVTGAPVVFVGMGEGTNDFEMFRPDGMAGRILGFGDVVGLIQDFEEVVDQKEAAEKAAKLLEGDFTLDDFLDQVRMIQKMGSLRDLVDKMPFFPGGIPQDVNLDDKEMVRIEAMIQSMTKEERNDAYLLIREPSRVKRVAKGSGQPEIGVQELVQKFLFMRQMMTAMKQNSGLLGKIPGLKQMSSARQIRRAMKKGAMPGGMDPMAALGGMGMPGMGMPGMGMPGMGMPGMGMPGMGMPGMGMPEGPSPAKLTRKKPLGKAEKNARKAQRRRERKARKKSRGK